MDIDIGRGLVEARALAATHKAMLAAYVGIGVVIPFLLLSSEPLFSLRAILTILGNPWLRFGGSIAGPLYLLAIIGAIVAGAMLAAWNGLLADMREGYIAEIMYGMVAGVAYFACNMMVSVVTWVITLFPIVLVGGRMEWENLGGGAIAIVYPLLLTIIAFWIATRFCLAGAIMGGRGKLEPIGAFIESWRRTQTAQWRLCGFYLLYGLPFAVLGGGLMALHMTTIMNNAPGTLVETAMSFGWAALFALYFLGQILIPAGFYRASEPAAAATDIFA
ncbi:MAG: hypothetical protein JHD35_20990 [Sphingopyxis sp.]|nr:hypothetical protein [Sphingopyxis sp.]